LAADVVYLKSGSKVEGRIAKETPEAVIIETQSATLTYPRDLIEKIEREPSLLEMYREKLAAAKTVEDYQELLSWCEANRFDTGDAKEKLRHAVASRRRAENPDTYCQECAAYGQIGCEKCRRAGSTLQDRGSGKAALPCTQCRGEGTERCSRCGGTLQAPCVRCKSTGLVLTKCNACDGTGRNWCRRCNGSGRIAFPGYRTRHDPAQVDCPDCRGVRSTWPCSACKATGQISVPCPSCLGKRTVQCTRCDRKGVVACSGCGGKGTVEGACPKCQGEGLVPCVACQGTGISPPKMAAPKVPAAQ
jgi:hypothetical protein